MIVLIKFETNLKILYNIKKEFCKYNKFETNLLILYDIKKRFYEHIMLNEIFWNFINTRMRLNYHDYISLKRI